MAQRDIKAKKKPSKLEDMSKEQIREAILKKRECNTKAQNIVESLLERDVDEDFFTKCLPDINQSHFEDIIEERSIIKLCGYPLCSQTWQDKDIPKQKYRISIKTNKVYDITARKSFCSNVCYKSAMYVKKQMLTSPLWFREYEEIPTFHLLPLDASGSMGQEIDLSLVEKLSLKDDKPSFTSINDFAEATIKDMSDKKILPEKPDLTKSNCVGKENKHDGTGLKENIVKQPESSISNSSDLSEKQSTSSIKPTIKNPLNIIGEVFERPGKKVDPILVNKPDTLDKEAKLNRKQVQKKQPSIPAIIIEVEKHLAEWFTLDTLIFLFGEDKVKEMVADKGECIKEYLNNYSKSIFYTSNTYDQYQALCRKLNMLELEDRKQDSQTLQRETKPLPDYSILKEESKKIQLKVKAFYTGETEVVEPVELQEAVMNMKSNTEDEDANLTQIPIVDKNAQNALRRKIVCQQLNKVLPGLLRSLGLLSLSITSDVRLLVNTFKLQANNIMFRPIQWTLVAIIFIKLLSIRDTRLQYLLGQSTSYKHLQLLLLSYNQDGGYLDRLISWLTDVDRLLQVNDTQLTLE